MRVPLWEQLPYFNLTQKRKSESIETERKCSFSWVLLRFSYMITPDKWGILPSNCLLAFTSAVASLAVLSNKLVQNWDKTSSLLKGTQTVKTEQTACFVFSCKIYVSYISLWVTVRVITDNNSKWLTQQHASPTLWSQWSYYAWHTEAWLWIIFFHFQPILWILASHML